MSYLRLGVNIDHVATVRNARGGNHPDPIKAAQLAMRAGADGITAHLREDRRHINDDDIERLVNDVKSPLNFEMAATDEMLTIALRHKPHAVCIVPEKREEVTTEGGLDVVGQKYRLQGYCEELISSGSRVSLFIEGDRRQLEEAASLGVPVVEIHAGAYAEADNHQQSFELEKIITAAHIADELGLECHVGHGLNFDNVGPIAKIQNVVELNIGHFLIGEGIFGGLSESIKKMRLIMDRARFEVS